MSRIVSKSEADRLGKRGSYRLGGLAQQGVGESRGPRQLRMSFAPAGHAGPVSAWVLAAIVATAVVAGMALLGLWFVPFVAGLATGIAIRWGGWRLRVSVPAVIVMTAGGWALALLIPVLRGLPVRATARTIAALAGLPAHAFIAIAVTLAVSVVQGLAGLWLGRALAPRPPRD
jgi:hypothetical protein